MPCITFTTSRDESLLEKFGAITINVNDVETVFNYLYEHRYAVLQSMYDSDHLALPLKYACCAEKFGKKVQELKSADFGGACNEETIKDIGALFRADSAAVLLKVSQTYAAKAAWHFQEGIITQEDTEAISQFIDKAIAIDVYLQPMKYELKKKSVKILKHQRAILNGLGRGALGHGAVLDTAPEDFAKLAQLYGFLAHVHSEVLTPMKELKKYWKNFIPTTAELTKMYQTLVKRYIKIAANEASAGAKAFCDQATMLRIKFNKYKIEEVKDHEFKLIPGKFNHYLDDTIDWAGLAQYTTTPASL